MYHRYQSIYGMYVLSVAQNALKCLEQCILEIMNLLLKWTFGGKMENHEFHY